MLFTVEHLKELEESKKVRKWYHVDADSISSVDFRGTGIIPDSDKTNGVIDFIVGEEYSLQGMACRGFKPKVSTYKVVGIAESVHGVPLDSVIVKQLTGEVQRQFALTPDDCQLHGVEYEEGLILLPKAMNWKRVCKHKKFDPQNMATTPPFPSWGYINTFLLKVSGFKDLAHGYVITPSGLANGENETEKTVCVMNKIPLVLANGNVIPEDTVLVSTVVKPKMKGIIFKYGNFIASDDSMYIRVMIPRDTMFDGIDPEYIDGVRPGEMFDIKWEETNAMTLEELEKKKFAEIEKKRKREERTNQMVKRMNTDVEKSMLMLQKEMSELDPLFAHIADNIDAMPKNITDEVFQRLTKALGPSGAGISGFRSGIININGFVNDEEEEGSFYSLFNPLD